MHKYMCLSLSMFLCYSMYAYSSISMCMTMAMYVTVCVSMLVSMYMCKCLCLCRWTSLRTCKVTSWSKSNSMSMYMYPSMRWSFFRRLHACDAPRLQPCMRCGVGMGRGTEWDRKVLDFTSGFRVDAEALS